MSYCTVSLTVTLFDKDLDAFALGGVLYINKMPGLTTIQHLLKIRGVQACHARDTAAGAQASSHQSNRQREVDAHPIGATVGHSNANPTGPTPLSAISLFLVSKSVK